MKLDELKTRKEANDNKPDITETIEILIAGTSKGFIKKLDK